VCRWLCSFSVRRACLSSLVGSLCFADNEYGQTTLQRGDEECADPVAELWFQMDDQMEIPDEGIEVLVSTSDVLARLTSGTASYFGRLRESGRLRDALALFNLAGGVLAGYDFETPDVAGFLAGIDIRDDESTLLHELFTAYGDYGKRQAGGCWIAYPLASRAKLTGRPAQLGESHQVILLPGAGLWLAPSFAAMRMDEVNGPLLLYAYGKRQSGNVLFYEVGPSLQPDQAAYVAFARAGDAVEWLSHTWRVRFGTGEKGHLVTLPSFVRQENGNWQHTGDYTLSRSALYPLTDTHKDGRMFRLRVLLADSPVWLGQHDQMPFARKTE
jgi:hypothetical protein